jgi:glycosyltransferase involved in cell wall biosynthesis
LTSEATVTVMSGAPEVSVVIPTRRRPDLLPRSVDAVLAQATDVPFEVLVVNDDREPLRCRLPSDVRLRILSSGARGVCVARNLGITEARGAIVAFTDDDTIAPPGWIDALSDALAASPDALGVEGPIEYGRDVDELYEIVPHSDYPGGYCSCNVAYRRDALFAAGLFDERFPAPGGEDVDLGLRVAALGPVVAAPSMVMLHPPRPARMSEIIGRGREVRNDWLLHTKHPAMLGTTRPNRFGGVSWRARRYARLVLDPAVIQGSPMRRARAVVLAAGTVTVGLVASCTAAMPEAPS